MFLVRLHVIQFTRYRRCSCKLSLATNFYMLSQLISFVKYFFKFLKTFLKCFKGIFSCKCCPPGSTPFIRQLFYVSISSRICQELFSFLSNFFFDLLRRSLSRTACIYYHCICHLSTDIFTLFQQLYSHFRLSWHFRVLGAIRPRSLRPRASTILYIVSVNRY